MVRSGVHSIALHNLTVGYDRHPAVHHVDWLIPAGTMAAIYGRNGSGKSTLLKALAGELVPMTGHIHGLPHTIAWLPQQALPNRDFPATVWDLVVSGVWQACHLWQRVSGWLSASQRAACHAAIAAVQLQGLESKPINTLSGGQLQRACFARLIVQDAPLILLDEPFAGMDNRTTEDLFTVLHQWQQQGKTIIAVLHDLTQIRQHFSQLLLLGREMVASGEPAQVLASHLDQTEAFMPSTLSSEPANVCHVISPAGQACASDGDERAA